MNIPRLNSGIQIFLAFLSFSFRFEFFFSSCFLLPRTLQTVVLGKAVSGPCSCSFFWAHNSPNSCVFLVITVCYGSQQNLCNIHVSMLMRWLRLGPQGTSDYRETRENVQPLLLISGKVYKELEILIKSWAVSLRYWGLGRRASKLGITGRHWAGPTPGESPTCFLLCPSCALFHLTASESNNL